MARFLLSATIYLAAFVSLLAAVYVYRIADLRRWQAVVILIVSVAAGALAIAIANGSLGSATGMAVGVGVFGLVSILGISYVLVRNFERKQLKSDYLKQDLTNYAHIRRNWLFGWLARWLER